VVEGLKAGKLQLNPHPLWSMPSRLTWDEDPFKQRNWRAQLHMLRWLDPLRRAAAEGDSHAAQLWWKFASSWIETALSAEEHPFAWMDMVDGVRAKELVLGFPFVPDSDRPAFVDAVERHGQWLVDPAHRGHSNHAMHQLLGLFIIGRFLRNEEWTRQSVEQLRQLLEHEYDAEGVNREGALAYHLHNYTWWGDVLQALTVEGVPLPAAAARLEAARLQLVHATRPDGLLETIGDTARTPMKLKDSPQMLYAATLGADGTPPEDTFASYSAGYVFGRSGWGQYEQDFKQETFYSVMHGTGVKVHGHDEAGAVTYYTRGTPWVVDPGKYAYVSDDFRRHIVSRAAHSLLHLPGEARRAGASVTAVWARHTLLSDDILLKDQGYEGVEIRRRVVFHRPSEALVVIDSVKADRTVRAVQNWQLGPEVEVEPARNGYRLTSGDSGVRIIWTGRLPERKVVAGATEPFTGWVSQGWMDATPAPAIAAVQEGSSFRMITVLGPERNGHLELQSAVTLPGGIGLRLASGRAVHEFSVAAGAVTNGIASGSADKAPTGHSIAIEWLLNGAAGKVVETVSDRQMIRLAREALLADPSAGTRRTWAAAIARRLVTPDRRALAGDDGLASALVDVVGSSAPKRVGELLTERLPKRRPVLAPVGEQHVVQGGVVVRAHEDALEQLRARPATVVHAALLEEGLVVPWAARGGQGDVLLVRLHGAVDRQRLTLPAWPALTSANRGKLPFLIVQDPSLDLKADMRLSWYLGMGQVDGHSLVAGLIGQVRRALGAQKALVVGSSGGGFAALQVAGMDSSVTALAFNPQTDIREYHRPAANVAAQAVFETPDIESAPEARISLLGRWRDCEQKPRAVIVSNLGDTMHNGRHVLPFKAAVDEEGLGHVSVHAIDSGPGHVAPSAEEMDGWIEQVLEDL